MKTSIVIATYGENSWREMALNRAYPSTDAQGAFEVIVGHEPEMTIAEVRNKLAAQATGDWLCFLDADDRLAPSYLYLMEKAHATSKIEQPLYTPKVSFVHGGRAREPLYIDPNGRTLHDENYLVLGTVVRRDLFTEVGGFSDYPHGYEDWSLWAKCWKAGAEVVRTDAVYIYHWNRQSKMRQAWKDRKWQLSMHNQIRRELFPELYRQETPSA